jgi:hypothetical protein
MGASDMVANTVLAYSISAPPPQPPAPTAASNYRRACIRETELLPTKNQVEPYKASFELLIQEVIVRVRHTPDAAPPSDRQTAGTAT